MDSPLFFLSLLYRRRTKRAIIYLVTDYRCRRRVTKSHSSTVIFLFVCVVSSEKDNSADIRRRRRLGNPRRRHISHRDTRRGAPRRNSSEAISLSFWRRALAVRRSLSVSGLRTSVKRQINAGGLVNELPDKISEYPAVTRIRVQVPTHEQELLRTKRILFIEFYQNLRDGCNL